MGSQAIGEVNVQITGDYSQLSDDLAQAQSIAAAAGGKVAQSFTGAAKSTDELTDSLGRSRAASEDEVNALGAAADKVNNYTTAIENALGPERDQLDVLEQMPKSYTEMTAAQQASIDKLNEQTNVQRGATDATNQAKDAIGGLAGGAESGANAATAMSGAFQGMNLSVGSTVKSLAAFAGLQISITALKNAVEEALTSFAQLQRATESLTALEGSAKLASDAIGQLRQLAQDEALSFPSLLKADQQMAAFGLSTKQAVPLLAAAGDASRATGKDFDSVANSLERIVESGMAMGRTLVNVGLTTKDLGGAMGVTADQASKLFKSLDESTRVEVITAALAKFKGLAHDTADDLSGSWTQLANTANAEFQRVGAELSQIAPAFIAFGKGAIGALGGVADFFVTFVTTIVQKGGDLGNYLKNQAASWGVTIDDYAAANKKAGDSNTAFEASIGTLSIAARQLFSGFPDYQDKLTKLNAELAHGEIDQTTYAAKLEVLRGSFLAVQQPTLDAVTSTKSFTDSVASLKTQLDAHQISQAQYEAGINTLITAHSQATTNTKDEQAALKDLEAEYKNWAHGMDQAGTSISALLGYESKLIDATQTYIGTAKQQAAAFETYVVQSANALSGFGVAAQQVIKAQTDLEAEANKQAAAWNQLVDGYNKGAVGQEVLVRALGGLKSALDAAGISAGDLDVPLKTVGDTVLSVAGKTATLKTVGDDASKTIDGLNKELQDLGTTTGAYKIGLGDLNDTVKGTATSLHDLSQSATAADSVFTESLNPGITSSVQVFTTLDDVIKQTQADLDTWAKDAVGDLATFTGAVQSAAQSWQDFSSGAGSFGPQIGTDSQSGSGTGKSSKKNSGAFSLSNPYWDLASPDEMQKAYQELQNSFGGSAFNDFSAASYFLAAQRQLLNAALQNYYTENPGYDSAGNPPAPRASTAPASAPPAAATPAPTATVNQIGTGATDTSVQALNTTLVNSTSTLAASFGALTPVMQTATAQVTTAIQQQAASFQTLSTALAPLTAPAPTPYNPASFSREGTPSPLGSPLGGSTIGTVNNLTITPTPQIQTLLNSLMQELQRQGIRF